MDMEYQFIPEVAAEVSIPKDGILSRTLHNDDRVRLVVFGFAPGQELTEHTSKMAAILQVVSGEARLKLGQEEREVTAGAWVAMPPELPHSVYAKTPLIMLLMLLK